MLSEKPYYLLWLNWPIGAFRINDATVADFRQLVDGTVTVVRSETDFLNALPYATHAIVWEFKKEWFKYAQRLRILATPGAGRELLPHDDELPSNVVRVNGSFHGTIMSETVVACVMAHARGLFEAYRRQLNGELWPRDELSPFCSLVAGTKAVILGYGHIGKAIGKKLTALDVNVVGIGRKNIDILIDEVKNAQWLIMALPSDTGTDNLVDEQVLCALKKGGVVINVGRGNALDENALVKALKTGHLSGAYLDVFKREPLQKNDTLAENIPGLVRIPHASAFDAHYFQLFFQELDQKGFLKIPN